MAVEKPKPVAVRPAIGSFEVPKSREADDVARFLAGLKSREGSPFSEMEGTAAWKAHAAAFDADFAKYQERRIPAMQEFQRTELSGPAFDNANLFYPFGGPDFLNALIFFPERDAYVFVGLEPPGSVPSFKQFAGQDMAAQLPRMRRTLRSLLSLSYFQTLEMAAQIKAQVTDGLLPIILVQISRTGYNVVGWSPVTINDEGMVVKMEDVPAPKAGTPAAAAAAKRTPGFVIEFQKEGSAKLQRLYYFSTNVENFYLEKNKPFLAFLPRLAPFDAMYKAASYLSHRDSFSTIRGKVLELAQAVVEDDSGIPYKYFDQSVWDVTLYGGYTTPIPIFKTRMQPDLKAAYTGQTVPVKKLSFGLGYAVSLPQSNVLVAIKKQLPAPPSQQAQAPKAPQAQP